MNLVTNGAISIPKRHVVVVNDGNLSGDLKRIWSRAFRADFVVCPGGMALSDDPNGTLCCVNFAAHPQIIQFSFRGILFHGTSVAMFVVVEATIVKNRVTPRITEALHLYIIWELEFAFHRATASATLCWFASWSQG
jgi:hypothetical protein